MKKLFFLCAFLFVSIEMQAQLYIVHSYWQIQEDLTYTGYMTTSAPDGTVSTIQMGEVYPMVSSEQVESQIGIINAELNDIISQGYKLIHATTDALASGGLINHTYYLAVPWTTVGLTEIDSSELDLRISPNPANEYINVEVDFKSQPSELVLISESGYVYFKNDISNINSGQEFTLDISNIPAGKYLVTVKDNKQYLSPKKLIIF
jgi:hypothetical protein